VETPVECTELGVVLHVARTNTAATLPLGNGLPLQISQLNTLVFNSKSLIQQSLK
jgi:hypothetical protein